MVRKCRHIVVTINLGFKMFRLFLMFVTAVCVLVLIKLRWPKEKSIYDIICPFLNDPNHASPSNTLFNHGYFLFLKKPAGIRTWGESAKYLNCVGEYEPRRLNKKKTLIWNFQLLTGSSDRSWRFKSPSCPFHNNLLFTGSPNNCLLNFSK